MSEEKILTPIKAIRAWCINCSGFNVAEVRNCDRTKCPLYPYRMGHNPKLKGKRGDASRFAAGSPIQVQETK